MELDDFLYTSAGRGRYACFTGYRNLFDKTGEGS